MNNLKLIYVNPVGINAYGLYEYEFFFSEKPEEACGDDWDNEYPANCTDLLPHEGTYSIVKRLKTDIDLFCVQQNSCFSFIHCIDGCVALCNENLEGLEAYPEPYRIVLHFGDDYDKVVEHLAGRELYFDDDNTSEPTDE